MGRKILLLALTVLIFQFHFDKAYAIKAYPFPIQLTQPDGTKITVRVHGDEFNHYQTSEDGYLLKQDAKGYFKYATVDAGGKVTESAYVAKNIAERSAADRSFLSGINKASAVKAVQSTRQKSRMLTTSVTSPRKAYPLNGSPKALVILANFKDKAFTVSSPQSSFQNLLTLSGYSANGGTGSAKDYFMASTYGKFAPDFVAVGPVTLPQNLSYYGTNDANDNDKYPAQMIVDACAAADAAGLDFTQYDTDGDGYVDNVFVYYAGYNEAEGGAANTIWPHRWSVSDAGITSGITFDGKKINDYSCTSELKGTSGTNMCGIGTFCHEFGHVLGLPDFYDTSGTQSNTLDEWDIMDYGAYSNSGCTPPAYSAYERFFLGYLTPQQINTASDITLQPMYLGTTQPANTNQQAYLLSATDHNLSATSPSPAEFFILEYRKKTGWDAYLPAEGLCIWHIDYLQSAWDNNEPNNFTGSTQTSSSHMRVYLQPLSGQTTTPGTAFTTGSYTPTTWKGVSINRPITEITKAADKITFKLMGGQQGPALKATGTLTAFSAIVGTPSTVQTLALTGSALTANVEVALADQTNYEIKLASASSWSKTVTVVPALGSVSETLQVRYNPTSAGIHTDQLAISSTGATALSYSLSGSATAPVVAGTPYISVGKIDDKIQFPTVKVGKSKLKSFNVKTTNISGTMTVAISGANASMFAVSTSSLTKDAVNAGTVITVTYIPTTAALHTATLTISGGGLETPKVIELSGEGK